MTPLGVLPGGTSRGQTPLLEMAGWNKCNCTAGRGESHGYQGLPKGSVRTSYQGNQLEDPQVTAKIDYIEQVWASSTNALCGGDAQLV
jgi:hypothetical protein